MTTLLPTRVSIYDYLYQDTMPIDSVFADCGNISLPQARLLIEKGIQVITCGIIVYQQHHGAENLLIKLFERNQVKELRKYNAFNFDTMQTAIQYGPIIDDVVFSNNKIFKRIIKCLALETVICEKKIRHLLGGLTLLCLRELAILVDHAKLDANEVEKWMSYQTQFLELDRSINYKSDITQENLNKSNTYSDIFIAPQFDLKWLKITHCETKQESDVIDIPQIPNYAKVIRYSNTKNTDNTKLGNENNQLIVNKENDDEVLQFYPIDNIALPYQRWLLQLAKVSDIYLSKKWLKIAPEPLQPPARPLVSLGFIHKATNETTKPQLLNTNNNVKLGNNTSKLKNPLLIILILIIGGLTIMAIGKYKYKKSHSVEQSAIIPSSLTINNH